MKYYKVEKHNTLTGETVANYGGGYNEEDVSLIVRGYTTSDENGDALRIYTRKGSKWAYTVEPDQETPEEAEEEAEEAEETAPTLYDRMTAELEARRDRSAWDKGVTRYALELVADLEELAAYEGRDPAPGAELRDWLLNGADSWKKYSWGGSALIYDGDIAERLCTPSELKKTRNGERRPNASEEWLDVQARALYQASNRLAKVYSRLIKEEV